MSDSSQQLYKMLEVLERIATALERHGDFQRGICGGETRCDRRRGHPGHHLTGAETARHVDEREARGPGYRAEAPDFNRWPNCVLSPGCNLAEGHPGPCQDGAGSWLS